MCYLRRSTRGFLATPTRCDDYWPEERIPLAPRQELWLPVWRTALCGRWLSNEILEPPGFAHITTFWMHTTPTMLYHGYAWTRSARPRHDKGLAALSVLSGRNIHNICIYIYIYMPCHGNIIPKIIGLVRKRYSLATGPWPD